MTDPAPRETHDEVEARPQDDAADALGPWARLSTSALGLAAGVAGTFAVFVSQNQAGTAALLLVGAVLLLLGIQGTPLRRLGSGDHNVELATLRRRAVEVVEQSVREESPEVAVAVAEAVRSIDPGVVHSRPSYLLYEEAVLNAFRRKAFSFDYFRGSGSAVDARVKIGSGVANVEIKYRTRGPLGAREIVAVGARFRASGLNGGLVVVTNSPLSADANAYNFDASSAQEAVEVVTWNDERDDDLLVRALSRAAGRNQVDD